MAGIKIKVRPLRTPNFLILENQATAPRQDGFLESGKIPVKEAPKELILKLCEEFKQAMLEKAGY